MMLSKLLCYNNLKLISISGYFLGKPPKCFHQTILCYITITIKTYVHWCMIKSRQRNFQPICKPRSYNLITVWILSNITQPCAYFMRCTVDVEWIFSEIRKELQIFSLLKIHLKMKMSFAKCRLKRSGLSESKHWGRGKMAAISQSTLSNVFSWTKLLELIEVWLKFVSKGPINNIPALAKIRTIVG